MKRFSLLALLIGLLLIAAIPAFAATNTFTGTIPTNAPSMAARFSGNNCAGTAVGTFYYVTRTVNVSHAGDYTQYDIGWFDADPGTIDSYVAFYSGAFDPANPLSRCVDSGDDDEIFTLAAATYTMVITTYNPNVTGFYTFTLDGPGTITTSGACPYPLATNAVVLEIPLGSPVFYAADPATALNWTLPAGHWWVQAYSGDYAQVWIACTGSPVWVPASNVLR